MAQLKYLEGEGTDFIRRFSLRGLSNSAICYVMDPSLRDLQWILR